MAFKPAKDPEIGSPEAEWEANPIRRSSDRKQLFRYVPLRTHLAVVLLNNDGTEIDGTSKPVSWNFIAGSVRETAVR